MPPENRMNTYRADKFSSRGAKEKFTDAYTGGMNEQDALGEFKGKPGCLEAHKLGAEPNGFMPIEKALGFVREYTKDDPTNPRKPFAKELRLAVIDGLELEDPKEMEYVKFYTAVGTSADIFHGVDGWVEYTFPSGQQVVVTLDVTANPEKVSTKADVLIHEIKDPEEEEAEFMDQVERYGAQVVRTIRTLEHPSYRRAA